jgi:hypothetical protein
MPRLEQAMREADFVPRDHRENVAAHKMKLELLDVIKRRRHLKFTDVRDIVARNILRLPDPTVAEFFRGDRLARFDRTAARALPGVYRPGEIYIKGLQQLSAPLFGTGIGAPSALRPGALRRRLSGAEEPGSAVGADAHDTASNSRPPPTVLLFGVLANIVLHTGIGRHIGSSLWRGAGGDAALRVLRRNPGILRWPPLAELLNAGMVRGLGRNLVQPLLIGSLPLIPIIVMAVFVEQVPIEPGLWLPGWPSPSAPGAQYAGRASLPGQPVTRIGVYVRRINQAVFIGHPVSCCTSSRR